MDRTDEPPERFWVLTPFTHFEAQGTTCDRIFCGHPDCDTLLLVAAEPGHDKTALLMWHSKPICPQHALEKISEHPITTTYLKWMEEGDPRWWSPWFCNCDGCEMASEILSSGPPPG
jgi:hypothetical protein